MIRHVGSYIDDEGFIHVLVFNEDGSIFEHLKVKATDLDAVRLTHHLTK